MSSSTRKAPAITPHQTIQGHTRRVTGVVHLPSGRRIITCSADGSLRLWDLENGAQIGEDWRDENDTGMRSMALSPNAKIVASGSDDGKVKIWNVETRKVITKWTGHADLELVCALCWSADGKRVTSGSSDGTARVWDVESGKTVLTIKTGHNWVNAVMYSPDNEKIATGGDKEDAVKIWDSKTGELITTLKHDHAALSLAWTSDGKKLISGSHGPTRIFDTTTWQQIAVLEDHTNGVYFISLSPNNRFLASASYKTAYLWNLDTNLPIGPPLQHENRLRSTALSADGKVLVTGCTNGNVYSWDIHSMLKQAGLEDLLPISDVPARKFVPTSDATRRPAIHARRIPPGFFDGAQSSAAHGIHHLSSTHDPRRAASSNAHALLRRFSSLFRHSHSKTDGATELQQRPRRNIFSHRGPRIVDVPTVQDRKSLFVAPRPRPQQQSQSHDQGSSSQSRPTADSTSTTPAPGTGTGTATPGAVTAQSPPIPLWARCVLFLCCACRARSNGTMGSTDRVRHWTCQSEMASATIVRKQTLV